MKSWLAAALMTWGIAAGAQEISVTGNLSNPWTWQNAGQIGAPITCMAPGMPGYCGPAPAVGGFGDINGINFSYGLTDLYQNINIADNLPYQGTGLIVTGFVYSFTAKNGNGWDDGRQDVLSAYVNIYGPGGTLKENYNYNLNAVFDWTQFSFNETFASPYRANQLTTARFGLIGADNNGWAGFYGPEVINVGFSLKYSPDPCVTNPLSSPSCPGFAAAMASLTSAPVAPPAEPVATVAPAATTTTITTTAAPAATANAAEAPAERTPMLMSPRLLSIVRSVNESIAATVTATVTQSIEQSQSAAATQDLALIENISVASRTLGSGISSSVTAESDAGTGSLTRPGDPVAAARAGQAAPMTEESREESQQSRPAPAPPAELAGGVSMVALAQGADLTAYAQIRLRDAQFYAPREIYRGQAVVDNRSVLRGLGTDALHDRMVEEQYRK